MKKRVLFAVLAAVLLLCSAALADTQTLGAIRATVDIPGSYIVLRADNLDRHPDWLEKHGTTAEEMLADWTERGVLLQAWTADGDAVCEITAVRDTDAIAWHDIDDQTPQTRASYRKEHLSGTSWINEGYKITSAEWKKTAQGRFLMIQYKRTVGDTTYRGYMRKTIKNGYTITLDYQVHGRGTTTKDNGQLNKIWTSFAFTGHIAREAVEDSTTADVSATAEAENPQAEVEKTAHLVFTSMPPLETSTGRFPVEGSCDPGTTLIGVCMRMGSNEPFRYETSAGKNGRFKMNVQLPQEGVWLMTLTAEKSGEVVEEKVFHTTTYQSTLLTVNLDIDFPETMELTGDTLTISGTTVKQTTVQCMVDGKFDKQIRTNNSGRFSFKIDTSAEGDYNITLVFSKKNYSTRRFVCHATRAVSEADLRARALSTAIKPTYGTLTKRLESYTGRIMTYQMTVTSITESGDEWIVFGALRSTASGYTDQVVVLCGEQPPFSEGTVQRMYGTCLGSYQVQDSINGDQYLPCFELIFWNE